MKQPIPRNGTEPLKVGDPVQIVPEWQEHSDIYTMTKITNEQAVLGYLKGRDWTSPTELVM